MAKEDVANQESVVDEVSKVAAAQAKAKEAKRVARNEAKARIREAMKSASEGIAEVAVADLKLVVGMGQGAAGPRAAGTGRKSMNEQILDLFRDEEGNLNVGAKVSGMEIFEKFDIGYPRMKWLIIAKIKDVKDKDDRVWIDYNREDGPGGSYSIFGLGEETPEDWSGYLPSDESLL